MQSVTALFINRSNHPEMFCKNGVLKIFAKFTGKHLCQSLIFSVEYGPKLNHAQCKTFKSLKGDRTGYTLTCKLPGALFKCLSYKHLFLPLSINILAKALPELEWVPLTISYYLYSLRISKISSMLHHGSMGRVHSKECYFIFAFTFLAFFFFFFVIFHQKYWIFIIFISFFDKVSNFSNRSETGIGDKKFPGNCVLS